LEKQQLRAQLASLHQALADADSVGPEARELLQAVMRDIQRLLDVEERQEEPEGLVDRLREAVEDFEESHPTLSEAAGRVIDALARMGI
jgi:predicted component of type VI protein secretion system